MSRQQKMIIPTESATVAINSIATAKIAAGIPVANLSAGEPKLPPHELLVTAVIAALKQGKTLYPPVAGLPELKVLASQWLNSSYDCHFQEQHCLPVNGGKLGIYLLLQLLMTAGDEVIFSAPYWVSYPTLVTLFGGMAKIVPSHAEEGWKLTPDALKKACSKKSRFLILNNAANPTGALYSRAELAELLRIAAEQDLMVISDEVYSELTYDDHRYISCGAFKEYRERVLLIQSCSKNFAMTGWRIGFVFAPENIIKPLTTLLGQCTSGVTTISQWAAVAVLQEAQTISNWVRTTMQERRNILCQALQKHFVKPIELPQSALYIFLALRDLGVTTIHSVEFCKNALEQANVALIPGAAFGQDDYIRLSFGAEPEQLEQGVKALAKYCG